MDHPDWPPLPLADWEPTYLTLHRWTQIVGKVTLALAPHLNHWWHVTMRVTPCGLATSMLCGERHLSMTFDFKRHELVAETLDAGARSLALEPMSVATFYDRVVDLLAELRIDVRLWPVPVEVKDTTPFPQDRHHAAYDRAAVERLHRVLLSVDSVFSRHRGWFVGKSSPVQFFWGSFDLAVTRFSGKRNPMPPPGKIMSEAYSHEVISHGFWPGGDFVDKGRIEEPVFYAYALPEPEGFARAHVEPAGARYDAAFGEYLLPYEAVRTAEDPDLALLSFMETTYLAAARAAHWNVDDLREASAREEVALTSHLAL